MKYDEQQNNEQNGHTDTIGNLQKDATEEAGGRSLTGTSRRSFLKSAVGTVAAGSLLGSGMSLRSGSAAAASESGGAGQQGSKAINIGFIEDFSGNIALYGIQKLHAAQLAVAEINQGLTLTGGPIGIGGLATEGKRAKVAPTTKLITKKGEIEIVKDGGSQSESDLCFSEDADSLVSSGEKGLLGRQVKLNVSDGQSQNRVWQQLARKMIEQNEVDVLVAGFTSAEREAIRPIVDSAKQLYFYTNQYEGGVADKYTFCTGPTPEQQVIPDVQYMVRRYGPKGYIVASNYNFGQLTAAWTKAYTPLVGGEIVGEQFVPLSSSQFSQVISKIRQAKPDWLMVLLVSQSNSNFYPQAAAQGLKVPKVSTINMMQGYEHLRFSPPAMANMHNAMQYMPEIPTKRNQAFVKRFFKMFPDDSYIGGMAQNTYFTIHLYAKAVRLAGTTDQKIVRKVLESGWSIDAPEGAVFLEPATHACAHHIRMAESDENQNISFVRDWQSVESWWLQRLGVNLVEHPLTKQFTPEEDPFFKFMAKLPA